VITTDARSAERFTFKGQYRHVPAALDRRGQFALVPSAVAGDTARHDLAPIRHEATQQAFIFEINVAYLVLAKATDFPSSSATVVSHNSTFL